jgi:hypothetical protein
LFLALLLYNAHAALLRLSDDAMAAAAAAR